MRGLLISLVPLMLLAGCGSNSPTTNVTPTPSLTGNWQIQTSAATPTTPLTGILLLGSLQSQGSTVIGTFRVFYLSGSFPCGNSYTTPTTFTGSFDASRNLTLASADGTIKVQLAVPTTPTSFGNGTIQTFGSACALAGSTPAFGAQFAPVTGTYAGPVTANTTFGPPPVVSGTVTLSLTEASTPQADGQFPLTGTLNFSGGTCANSVALTGTVSGGEVLLAINATGPLSLGTVRVNSFALPDASKVMAGELFYAPAVCSTGVLTSSDYSGTLTRQ